MPHITDTRYGNTLAVSTQIVSDILNESGHFKGHFSTSGGVVYYTDHLDKKYPIHKPNDWLRSCLASIRDNRKKVEWVKNGGEVLSNEAVAKAKAEDREVSE